MTKTREQIIEAFYKINTDDYSQKEIIAWVESECKTVSDLTELLDTYATHVLKECLGEERKVFETSYPCTEMASRVGHNTHRHNAIEKAREKFGLNLK